MKAFQTAELARHATRQAGVDAAVGVVDVHVLERRRGSSLSEVDVLVRAVASANEHEAAAGDAGMVLMLLVLGWRRCYSSYLTMPITPTQKTVAIMLSAALPPSFSTSVPMLLQIELSDATAPS
jgi:hypothetical protein